MAKRKGTKQRPGTPRNGNGPVRVRTPQNATHRAEASRKAPARPVAQNDGAVAVENAPATDSKSAAKQAKAAPFVIVGVGASAGGLEACIQILRGIPADAGLAIVLIQHLAPRHESVLAELLAESSKLPVTQVSDGMQIEANHVYVIPPNAEMGIVDGKLHLIPRPDDRAQFLPINFFFRSLAAYTENRSVGVVLSGTASDGAAGLREIKAAGGITIVQDPQSARYDGMPRAAIATGMVDLVLPPGEIADELVRIARHPLVQIPEAGLTEAEATDANEEQLKRIFMMLRNASGVDFTQYKRPTIQRRLHRRMVLHKTVSLDQYIRYLQQNPEEVTALYQDLLIHVTRFFREPESFQVLNTIVFPRILERHGGDAPIRIWVPGCSTGEEPYSIAIALLEFLGDRAGTIPVQIFATDVSEWAIDQARVGAYPESIIADVSPERLRRFFTRSDGTYRISKPVRDMCIFARQDLTRDPPFSKLDLVVCRNVLIYLGPAIQKRLMSVFHYALKPSGFLMLGSAETIGAHLDLFSPLDRRHKVYTRKVAAPRMEMEFAPTEQLPQRPTPGRRPGGEARPSTSIQNEANRVILNRYAPPGVIVDDDMQIVQFRGQTGHVLEPSPGEASLNLLKMAREGLLYGLRTAIHEARKTDRPVRKEGLHVRHDSGMRELNIEVVPLAGSEGHHFLVLFEGGEPPVSAEPPQPKPPRGKKGKATAHKQEHDARDARLHDELAATREHLQSIIHDLEAANEELQSANEEVLSSNEELQSTNEELDTAKEELQSTNEELNTVNEELQGRNEELSRANSDLVNLLGSVQLAIVMVASNLRIRRFTPMAEKVLNLIPSDVGRPITDIKPNIDCPDLERLISEAIDTVSTRERQVRDRRGNAYALRIRPYKNTESKIDGAVLALIDQHDADVESTREKHRLDVEARDLAEAVIDTVREPLVVLEADLRVRQANRSFLQTFHVSDKETRGRFIYDLGNGQWNIPALRKLLEEALSSNARVDDFGVEHSFPDIGHKVMMLNARRIEQDENRPAMILLAIEDVTGAEAK